MTGSFPSEGRSSQAARSAADWAVPPQFSLFKLNVILKVSAGGEKTKPVERTAFEPANSAGFQYHQLSENCGFWVGGFQEEFVDFEKLWQMHPSEFHQIRIHGRLVKTPRWQQAYGINYHYTGRVNVALPVPPILALCLSWARADIYDGLNGLLLNWYDGRLGHYIGRHRDSTREMVPGAPIVTISSGEERIFRLRRWREKSNPVDFPAHGAVFVMPWETNLAFTHEVPHSKRSVGRRISLTLRCFKDPGAAPNSQLAERSGQ